MRKYHIIIALKFIYSNSIVADALFSIYLLRDVNSLNFSSCNFQLFTATPQLGRKAGKAMYVARKFLAFIWSQTCVFASKNQVLDSALIRKSNRIPEKLHLGH